MSIDKTVIENDSRDSIYTKAVMEDAWDEMREYAKEIGASIPDDEKMFKASVYRAVKLCDKIPDEVKTVARNKCIAIGFDPDALED